MQYRVKTPLKVDETTTLSPGERISLDPRAARELLAVGAIAEDSADALAQGHHDAPPALDPEIEGAFPDEAALAAMDLDALESYVAYHFSRELADGLTGTEAQVRDQVRELIAQAKSQRYAERSGK